MGIDLGGRDIGVTQHFLDLTDVRTVVEHVDRRAMAAWRRTGDLGKFEAKLTNGLREHGYSQEFAAQIGQQIKGFGEYGFPESRL
jgi:hypothetical protein